MATEPQITANRNNAELSTGPRTEAGKAASSRNAVKHGLSSPGVVLLPGESREDLDALSASLTAEHNPSGDTEAFLVHQMISARWKLLRIVRLEAEALEQELEKLPGLSPDSQGLYSITSRIFMTLERYRAAAERSYHRAVRELRLLRKEKQNEANAALRANEKVAKQAAKASKPPTKRGLLDQPIPEELMPAYRKLIMTLGRKGDSFKRDRSDAEAA